MAFIPARQQQFLDVRVTLGRAVTLCVPPAVRVQVLVETAPCSKLSDAKVDTRLVVDRSSSMAEQAGQGLTKIALAQQALKAFCDQMRSGDRVLLASFNERGSLDVPHSQADMFGLEKHRLAKAIGRLQANGNTFISEALDFALDPNAASGTVPRVFLFTDGESTIDVARDHARLVELADVARASNVPLAIYGTGIRYNWSLLQQLAIRAGNGSFCKHVSNVAELEGHLLGELAFMRGTAIEQLRVSGSTKSGVNIVSVTVMAPMIRELPNRDVEHEAPDFFIPRMFQDSAGSLDVHRGQQYLIEMEVVSPKPGTLDLIKILFGGKILATRVPLTESVEVRATFTQDPGQESPVDPRVMQVVTMMAGAKAAHAGKYDRASDLFARAGDPRTSEAMKTLHQMSVGRGPDEDIRRTGCTSVDDSICTSLGPIDALRRGRGDK